MKTSYGSLPCLHFWEFLPASSIFSLLSGQLLIKDSLRKHFFFKVVVYIASRILPLLSLHTVDFIFFYAKLCLIL